MGQGRLLRSLLSSERPLLVPDAYDALSARMIESAGFKAVQCSGYSMALAACLKTEDDLTLERNLQVTKELVGSVSVPVMADGEDGFGPPEIVASTVKAFLDVGIAGINLEDQKLREPGIKDVVDVDLMVEKILAARSVDSEIVINGRTDALAVAGNRTSGLKEAVKRATRYLEAGADLAFVTAVASLDEAAILVKEIPGPVSIAAGLPYNTGTLPLRGLMDCGVARISLPTIAVFATIQAIKQTMETIKNDQDLAKLQQLNLLCSMEDLARLK